MEPILVRTNTLSSSSECHRTPLFQALSAFFENSMIETYIYATKYGSKRIKSFLLVLLVSTENDIINSYYCQVKHSETGKQIFNVKTRCNLAKLRLVNGISENEGENSFELVFVKHGNNTADISYKWVAESTSEKKQFLISLWKLLNEQGQGVPQFLNVNYSMLQENLILSKTLKKIHLKNLPKQPSVSALETKEYKYVTGEEERDLEIVTDEVDWTKENTQKFREKLENELSGLDKANIHSIMSVENDITKLFMMMDHALHELCRLETIMSNYENRLALDSYQIEDVLLNYTDQQTIKNNRLKLLNVAENLLENISLDDNIIDTIQNLPMKTTAQIFKLRECIEVVEEKRKRCLSSPLYEMDIVKEAEEKLRYLLNVFKERVTTSLSDIIKFDWNASQSHRHSKLIPLTPVSEWLSSYCPTQFAELVGKYQLTAQQTYERFLKEFLEEKKVTVHRKSSEKLFAKFGSRKAESIMLSGHKVKSSTSALNSKTSLASQSNTSLDSIASCRSENEVQGITSHGQMFESSVREALDFIEKTMNREESFIHNFFCNVRSYDERCKMVEMVLGSCSTELDSFIECSCKGDVFYAIPIYLSLLDKLDDTVTDTYPYKVFRQSLDLANKFFNYAHKEQKTRILEVNRKSHRGNIVDSVRYFTQYLLFCESLQTNTPRTSIATSYDKLSDAVGDAIEMFASQNVKAPKDVVIAENYHYIYHFLFRNKIESLDKFRSKCHKKYKSHLELYVKAHLGTPMEKINQFFDGVEMKLNSGVRKEEIGFDPEFSKQKIKALTAEYSLKEIKKGLESIMKKIEKHFTKEQNLFKLACLSMQAEFVKQVEGYQKLMKECYPGSAIGFSFTIPEIHSIFEGRSPRH